MKHPKRLFSILLVHLLTIALLSLVTMGGFWGIDKYNSFKSDSEQLRLELVEKSKDQIQAEVNRAEGYIQHMISSTEQRLRQQLKTRTLEAVAIARNIYETNKNQLPLKKIQEMTKDALRPIRFNNDRGYYFAIKKDGIAILLADRPWLENTDITNMLAKNGEPLVNSMITAVQPAKKGYYEYYWTKPNIKKNHHKKIAYLEYFEPFDWYIGTGEYVEDVIADVQQEVLKRISKVRFGTNGYLFGSTYTGYPLFTNGKITTGGNSIWDLTDPDGKKIIQDQRKAVENPEGGFTYYSWKKLDSHKPSSKVAFVQGIQEWQWIIGSGFYEDEVASQVASSEKELLRRLTRGMWQIGALFTATLLVVFILAYMLSSWLRRQFDVFVDYFKKAAQQKVFLDKNDLFVAEFQVLAGEANTMIEKRSNAEDNLAKLNQNLEELIQERTKEIENKAGQLKNANERLLDLDKLKSALLSSVSHELRTPLTSIFGFTKIIHNDFLKHFEPLVGNNKKLKRRGQRILNNLNIISLEGERLTRLINDVLDLSKIESGHMQWRDENVVIKDMIEQACKVINGQLALKPTIQLNVLVDDNLPTLFIDRDRLAQVLINLLSNAIKFTDAGLISIHASSHQTDVVRIEVHDSGQGISEHEQDKIFDKFYQTSSIAEEDNKPKGTGLGLAICKEILNHYGGKIGVTSQSDKGATFFIELPTR